MKRVLLSLLAVGLSINLSFSKNFNSSAHGDWTAAATWGNVGSGGGAGDDYPAAGDDVNFAHNITYDVTSGAVTYNGNFNFNGGSLTLENGCSVFGFGKNLNLNIPLILESNTVFLLEGDLTVNSGGSITFNGYTSIFRMQTPSANLMINDTISIQNGVFAVQANGSNKITINGGGALIADNNSAIYLEGSNGQFDINGYLILKEGAELVADFNSDMAVNNNTAGHIVFEYGSSFYLGDNTNKVSINSNPATWEIQLTDSLAGWRHISSPFSSGFTLNDFVGTDLNPNVISGQENMFWWDADGGGMGNPAQGWQTITSSSTAFEAGSTPIVVYTGDANYPFSNNGKISITNSVNYQSSYTYNLYNSVDPTQTVSPKESEQGWNLIGNPYPTWLDLELFLTNAMAGMYEGAHMWDAQSQQYIAYITSNESIVQSDHDNGLTNSAATSSSYIRPFQAFWVKMDAASVPQMDIDILQSYRTYNPAAAPPSYFSSAFIPRLRLNAYAASDSAWDQVLITMNPNSSKLRLGNEDAFDRASANDRPNMALIHEDGERLCIDSRPLDSTTVFPLVFEQGVDAATYYISMVDDQFDASMSAYLEDLKTNTLHDLKNGAYSFTHDKSYATNRFNIHLAPSFVSQSELKLAKNNFQIWTANDKLFIQLDKAGVNQNLTIEVYDLSGKLVFGTATSAENTNTSIPLQLSAGAHIIKVNHPQYGSQVLKTIR